MRIVLLVTGKAQSGPHVTAWMAESRTVKSARFGIAESTPPRSRLKMSNKGTD